MSETVEQIKLQFEEWANEKGFCLDTEFFEDGNNYLDPDTKLAFEIWTKATEQITALQAENERLKAANKQLNKDCGEYMLKASDKAYYRPVMEWIFNPKRKKAVLSFTEGPERQIAYAVEWLIGEITDPCEPNVERIKPSFLLRPEEQCPRCGYKRFYLAKEHPPEEGEA